jgi:hypothetical protein
MTEVREETSDAPIMQQQHMGPRPKRVAMSVKQEDTQQDLQGDCRAGDCKANSQICHWTAENKCLDTVQELASCKKKRLQMA